MSAIYSKNCWLDGKLQEATVIFSQGIITECREGKHDDENDFTDAEDDVLMPGVIDAHVHVNEPGRTDWEGFDTATQAAAAGGITTIVDMPLNASPVTTTLEAFQKKLKATKGKLHVNCGFYGGLVPGNENEIQKLIDAGVLGIKAFLTHSGIDEFPDVGEGELTTAMKIMSGQNVPLLAHCELTDVLHGDALSANPKSYKAYFESRPKEWENEAVNLMIRLCGLYGTRVHIVHVSSGEALEQILIAKQKGFQLTAETCPHYIYFNAEEIPDGNTLYKSAPPVRERENNEKLKRALKTGVLDLIGSDHSPAPPVLKEIASGNLKKAWGGIAGLQFLLPASWTALRHIMQPETFIPLLTENPASMLGIADRKGKLAPGFDADLVIWSPDAVKSTNEAGIFHKHKISPYVSRELNGVVRKTFVNGELVYDNEKIINKNKGKWVLRK
jgi:allantoinase